MLNTQIQGRVLQSTLKAQQEPLDELFFQWRLKSAELARQPEEKLEKFTDALYALEEKILTKQAATMREMAIQFLVFTDMGRSILYEDAQDSLFVKSFVLASMR